MYGTWVWQIWDIEAVLTDLRFSGLLRCNSQSFQKCDIMPDASIQCYIYWILTKIHSHPDTAQVPKAHLFLLAPVKLPKEDWLSLTAWRWVNVYEYKMVLQKNLSGINLELFGINWTGLIFRKTNLATFKSLLPLYTLFSETSPSLYILRVPAHTHTPCSVCSYILPHGALSSGHAVTTHMHTNLHTSLKLSHTWQQRNV